MEILASVLAAEHRIRPYILQTPVEHSPWLSEETGADVWFKMEHIQVTGSFKLRGAANKLLSLTDRQRERGVITASTGNHGAALAYMAMKRKMNCRVYLPKQVSSSKRALMELYGAELIFIGHDSVEAERKARRVAQEEGVPFISPYNDEEVIAGQGTLGWEVERQLPGLDAIFVPVGGGGLISGVAGYLKSAMKDVEVMGCQPAHSAVMHKSVEAGQILDIPSKPTWSDGTAGGLEEGSITFDYCRKFVDRWAEVTEKEIEDSLIFLLQKHYCLVEGAAALSLATFRKESNLYRGKKVCLILCGRKMGTEGLKKLISKQ